jgi:hypothetical protein
VYLFRKADIPQLKYFLKNEFQKFLDHPGSVDDIWKTFIATVRQGIDLFIPTKIISDNKQPKWYSKEVRAALKRQRKLHARASKSRGSIDSHLYNNCRKETRKTVHKAYSDYLDNVVANSLLENPKLFWSHVKELKGGKSSIQSLRNNQGLVVTDSLEKAEPLT